jgi:hypothetical protein
MELKGEQIPLVLLAAVASKESSLRFLLSSVHETLSVAAMRVNDEDRSPRRIHGRDTTSYPSGFTEIVSDY